MQFNPNVERNFLKLRVAVEKCDSNAPTLALSVGKFTEAALANKEFTENVAQGIMHKANVLTTTFKHTCKCNIK